MTNSENPVFKDSRNLDVFINNLVKANIPKPEIGGRASFFAHIETLLTIIIPSDENNARKIIIKGFNYPSENSAKKIPYEITDSMFPGNKIQLDEETGMVLEKEDPNSKHFTQKDPNVVLRELSELIKNPKTSISGKINASLPQGVGGGFMVGEDGVLRGDVFRIAK